jgi:hypothetical protein
MALDPGFGLDHARYGLHPRSACLARGQASCELYKAGDSRTDSGPRTRENGVGEGSWSAACLKSVLFFFHLVAFSLSFSLLTLLFFCIKIFL